ncbi:MAG: hypothetical protein A2X02_00590 [Bacteroidetes bacterium GWF2_29_10]|nr:MAG: hypothetical protein A2X02_00590 [Bacteroidetes bacterium GWF2_29_10]
MKTKRIILVILSIFAILNIGVCQKSLSNESPEAIFKKIDRKMNLLRFLKIGNGKYITHYEGNFDGSYYSLSAFPNISIIKDVLEVIKSKDIDFYNYLYPPLSKRYGFCSDIQKKEKNKTKNLYYIYSYPIVYISYEQVLGLCKGLESNYNNLIDIWVKNNEKESLKIIVRLPSKEELQQVYSLFNPDNCIKNCNVDTTGKGLDLKNTLKHYFSYEKQKGNPACSFLYGNVAEMTNEKGIAMGGSWAHDCSYCSPDKVIKYDKPEPWLGFRLVFEVVRK